MSNSTSTNQNSKPSRGRQFAKWTLACAGVSVVLLAIGFYWYMNRAGRSIDAELARIRAADEPVSLAELDAFYAYPLLEKDATELWLKATAPLVQPAFSQAAGDLPIVGMGEDEIPPPGEPWADLAAVEQLLAKYQTSLDQMHEAAALGGAARFPIRFDHGFAALIEHVQAQRAGARLLLLEAHVHAHRGDARAAADSIHALAGMENSLAAEPLIISQLVRYAIASIEIDAIRRLLAISDFSEDDLLRMETDLATVDHQIGMRDALLGERAMGIDAFLNPERAGLMGAPGVLWRVTRRDDLVEYLRVMRGYVEASEKPFPDALQASADVEQQYTSRQTGSTLNQLRFFMTSQTVPALGGVISAGARQVARNRAARTAIAIERYHLAHGRRPERLGELTPDFLPEVLIDPHDGQPLRYVVGDGEYIIYSVGMNGVDDGGVGDETGEPDRVFVVKTAGDAP